MLVTGEGWLPQATCKGCKANLSNFAPAAVAVVVDAGLVDALGVAILGINLADRAAAEFVERNFPGHLDLTHDHWQIEGAVVRRVRQHAMDSDVGDSFHLLLGAAAAAAAVPPAPG